MTYSERRQPGSPSVRGRATALLMPPALAGLATAAVAWVSDKRPSALELTEVFGFWTLLGAIFEMAVLLPLACSPSGSRHRYMTLICGICIWYAVVGLGWHFLVLGIPFPEALTLSLPMLLPGVVVAGAFVALWSKLPAS
jgi:hypothetical protein